MSLIRVLLIDDDSTPRQSIATYLQVVPQFDVTKAENAQQALSHLKNEADTYTVLLLDFVLGGRMNGNQVLAKIRRLYPRLPVIVLTGKEADDGVQTLEKGAQVYQHCPPDLADLVNTIRNLAEQDCKWREMAADIRNMLGSDLSIAWQLDKKKGHFYVVAWDGHLDERYRQTVFLDAESIGKNELIQKGEPIFIADVTNQQKAPAYLYREEAQKRGWTSLICVPLVHHKRIIGFVDSYTYQPFEFDGHQRLIISSLRAFAHQAAETIRNIELSNRLETLQDINQLLAGIFDERTILKQILAKSLELVGADLGHIYLYDINRACLVLKEWIGIPGHLIEHTRKLGEGLTGNVAETGVAVNIADVSNQVRHSPIPGVPINSKVAVPLHREEQIIGVLSVKSRFYNAFTDDDVTLLSALAAQAAIAIERTRLNRHLQEVSRLALGGDYMVLLNYVVDAVRDLTFADVNLWMIGGREGEHYLRIVASSGNIGEDYIKNTRFAMDSKNSINVFTLNKKQPIIVSNITENNEVAKFYLTERALEQGWHCFMAVPLIEQEGKPLGVLSLYSKELDKFDLPAVDLIQTFANHAAIALEQQKKNRELEVLAAAKQRQKDELEALRQTTLKILAQEEDVTSLLEGLVEEATKLLKGKGGKLYLRVKGRDKVKLVAAKNIDPTFLPVGATFSAGEGMTGKVLQTQKSLIIKNYAQWFGRIEQVAHLFTAMIEVPLLLGNEVMGVLAVFDDEENKFTQQDTQILERLAQQGSLAIHNAQLFDRSLKRLQVLDALHETSLDMVRQLSFDKLMPELVKRAAQLMAGYEHKGIGAAYLRCDHENQKAIIEYSPNSDFVGLKLDFDKGLIGQVIRTARTQYMNDYPYWADRASLFDNKNLVHFIQNVIEVPVKEEQRVIAIIVITDASGKRRFSEADIELLERFADLAAIAIQNARLVDNAQRRIRELEIINHIVESISTQLNPDEVIETIISLIAKQLECTDCAFFLPEKKKGELVLVAKVTQGTHAEQIKDLSFNIGEGIAGWVFEHGTSRLLNEAQKHAKFAPARRIGEYEPRSLLVVPVKKGEQTIGIICADQDVEGWFSEYDKQFVETLARHAALAIERATLFQRIQQQKETQTRAIHEIANSIPSKKPLKETLESILDSTLSLMGETSLGEIRLLDEKSNEVVVEASHGELRQEFRRLPVGKGITGWVAKHKTSQLIGDVRKDKRYVQFLEETRSELAVPMLREDGVIGVLNIEHPKLNAFTEEDQKLAEAIAGLAVVAIENHRLFEQLNDRATRLERLQEVTTTISAESFDLKKVLRLIVDSLSQIFGDSPCLIRLYDAKKDEFTHQVAQTTVVPKEQTLDTPRPNRISRYVLKTGAPYYVEDSNHIPSTGEPTIREAIIVQGVRARAALPLKSENEVIGLLYLNRKNPAQFSQNDKQILQLFATQAVVAVKNAQLYEQIQEQREAQIKVFQKITTSIAIDAPISREEVLNNIIKSMVTLMGKSALFLVTLFDKNTDELVLAAFQGEIVSESPPIIRSGEGVTGWVAQHKTPLIVPDISQYPDYIPGLKEARSELAVPMLKGDELIGVLNIEHPELNPFTQEDVKLAEAIAGLAVVALENNRLQEAQEKATAAEKLAVMGHVTAEFVHRMNNLVGTIPVRVNMAKEYLHLKEPKDAKVIKQLDRIAHDTHLVLQAAQQLKRTTEARIPEHLVVNDLIDPALKRVWFEQAEAKAGIDVVKRLSSSLPPVYVDRKLLFDTLLSISRNAIQAMPEGGTLALSTRKSIFKGKTCVELVIKDNGVGIPSHDLANIFDLFFTTKEKGLGFGLWRDKTFIKMLGGDIEVESVFGQGSTFTIKLPVVS